MAFRDSMNLCDNGHDEVCYTGRGCPVCEQAELTREAKQRIEIMDEENERLHDELEALKEENERLHDELEALKHDPIRLRALLDECS